jgi:hypothetical protein
MGSLKPSPSQPAAAGAKAKRFTAAEANRALPLVSRVARDIAATYARLEELRRQRQTPVEADRQAAEECERQARRAAERLDELAAELSELGVELKNLELGLVDFPGSRNGRKIMLCWKLGEPQVRFWHDADAGFADRRPIDEACE